MPEGNVLAVRGTADAKKEAGLYEEGLKKVWDVWVV